jgi:hypothetical protein
MVTHGFLEHSFLFSLTNNAVCFQATRIGGNSPVKTPKATRPGSSPTKALFSTPTKGTARESSTPAAVASLVGQNPAEVARFLVEQFLTNADALAAIAALADAADKSALMAGLRTVASDHKLVTLFSPLTPQNTPLAQQPEQSSAILLAAVRLRE